MENYSWLDFILVVSLLLIVYYLVIFFKYYYPFINQGETKKEHIQDNETVDIDVIDNPFIHNFDKNSINTTSEEKNINIINNSNIINKFDSKEHNVNSEETNINLDVTKHYNEVLSNEENAVKLESDFIVTEVMDDFDMSKILPEPDIDYYEIVVNEQEEIEEELNIEAYTVPKVSLPSFLNKEISVTDSIADELKYTSKKSDEEQTFDFNK